MLKYRHGGAHPSLTLAKSTITIRQLGQILMMEEMVPHSAQCFTSWLTMYAAITIHALMSLIHSNDESMTSKHVS